MSTTVLVTIAASTCLVLALGCHREPNAPSGRHRSKGSDGQTTVILGAPPASEAADRASTARPRSPVPEPAMSTPPIENVADTPASAPAPMPAPAVPRRSPSQYRDRCGRPLVA